MIRRVASARFGGLGGFLRIPGAREGAGRVADASRPSNTISMADIRRRGEAAPTNYSSPKSHRLLETPDAGGAVCIG